MSVPQFSCITGHDPEVQCTLLVLVEGRDEAKYVQVTVIM